MYPTNPIYTMSAANEQESRSSLNVSDHLRTSRASIAQTKLALARLRRCYSSPRARGVLDQLCGGMDAALSTLERLDFGRSVGSAS
jgi:hypothetical protein